MIERLSTESLSLNPRFKYQLRPLTAGLEGRQTVPLCHRKYVRISNHCQNKNKARLQTLHRDTCTIIARLNINHPSQSELRWLTWLTPLFHLPIPKKFGVRNPTEAYPVRDAEERQIIPLCKSKISKTFQKMEKAVTFFEEGRSDETHQKHPSRSQTTKACSSCCAASYELAVTRVTNYQQGHQQKQADSSLHLQ